MRGKTLRYTILLATISVTGILLIQFFFLKSSYNYTEQQFRESTSVALKEVAWQLLQANSSIAEYDSIAAIEMISSSYYIVNVNTYIDPEQLKELLIDELNRHDIYTSFEFAIFNKELGEMEHKTLITSHYDKKKTNFIFPLSEKYDQYFGIHFPNRSGYFYTKQLVWYLFTSLLILVVIFFGYTMYVIIQQRKLTEVQKNFINNLTHELKTPISSIGLAADVLSNRKIAENPDRLVEYAEIIKEQNKRLSKNVEKVLKLASLEKNKIYLNLEEIEINEFVQKTVDSFKQSTYGQKAKISVNLLNDPQIINADTFHFNNLILNILENAVKYCAADPYIVVDISKSAKVIMVQFIDNGIGIPVEYRNKIFKKFYRIPTGNVHNVKGFGLGLDYVAQIVKAHNWKILIDDNSKGGSIFKLEIPLS